MADFKIGDKVEILAHRDAKYIGRRGVLLSVETPPPSVEGQVVTWKVCKIKLEDTGEIVEVVLSQFMKVL
ncbi:MAG: hypothetical protein HYX79_07820 [Chloroflexi bacterium]|nr:hypothetical protein [Chloroflexota bacterium]